MKITCVPSTQDVPGLGAKLARISTKSLLGAVGHCHPGSDLTACLRGKSKRKVAVLNLCSQSGHKEPTKLLFLQLTFYWAGIEWEVKWSFCWIAKEMDVSCRITCRWLLAPIVGLHAERSLRAAGLACPVFKWGPWFPPLDYHLSWGQPHGGLVTVSCVCRVER